MPSINEVADGSKKVYHLPPFKGSPRLTANGLPVAYTIRGNALFLSQPIERYSSVELVWEEQTVVPYGLSKVDSKVTGSERALASNGLPASNRVKATSIAVRYANVSSYGDYDTSSFRQIWTGPWSGRCLVFAEYAQDKLTADTIAFVAIAAGRNIAETDPLNSDGTPAAWTVHANVAISAADADRANNGKEGVGITPGTLLNIPLNGAVYVGTKRTGLGRCYGSSPSRPYVDWQNDIGKLLPSMQYRSCYKAGDFVSVNQGGMGTPTNTAGGLNPCVGLIVIPLDMLHDTFDNVGDSTSMGFPGTRNEIKQFMNFNWCAVMVDMRTRNGKPSTFANHAYEGWTATRYLTRYEDWITVDLTRAGSYVFLQPFSWNGNGFDDATIAANWVQTKRIAEKLIAAGKIPILRTVGPVGAASLAQDDIRKKWNEVILASGYNVFDFDILVSDQTSPAKIQDEYNLDGTHYTRAFMFVGGIAAYNYTRSIGI